MNDKPEVRRYFHVHYFFQGGVGSTTVSFNGMMNLNEFVAMMNESYPELKNVGILSWVEMNEADAMAFTKESTSL